MRAFVVTAPGRGEVLEVAEPHALPDAVDATAGALVESGGNELRAVAAAALEPGFRLLTFGPGKIGLLCALFPLTHGVEVHVAGQTADSLDHARALGVHSAWRPGELPPGPWDAVIDATSGRGVPAAALDLVEPGRNHRALRSRTGRPAAARHGDGRPRAGGRGARRLAAAGWGHWAQDRSGPTPLSGPPGPAGPVLSIAAMGRRTA